MKTYSLKRSVFFSLLASASIAHADIDPSAIYCKFGQTCPIPGKANNESTFYDFTKDDGNFFECVVRGKEGFTTGFIYPGRDFLFVPKAFYVFKYSIQVIQVDVLPWQKGKEGQIRIWREPRVSWGKAEVMCKKY